ncbi:hypothetical protein yfred0001_18910 [Yersinia frederiksenii ATCC 33641]|nr:hypothetical protein yfred0001_18910 [Yersinia frederiksenii ATCC 33641]
MCGGKSFNSHSDLYWTKLQLVAYSVFYVVNLTRNDVI